MSQIRNSASQFFLAAITESALYIPRDGALPKRSCKVIFDEETLLNSYEAVQVNNSEIVLDVVADEFPNIAKGDVFHIGTKDYMVLYIFPEEEGIIPLGVGKPNYKLYPMIDSSFTPAVVSPGDNLAKIKVI